MLPWLLLAAAVVATLPVRLALRVDINQSPTFEAVAYVYGLRLRAGGAMAWKDLLARLRDDGGGPGTPIRRVLAFADALFGAAVWSRLAAQCRVGTGDAFATALTAAALGGALRGLGARWNADVTVAPEFGRPYFALSVRCILFFRGGDIIRAAAVALGKGPPTKRKAGSANGAASH